MEKPLSRREQTRLATLISKVDEAQRANLEAATALLEIHEDRLYRESHDTFEGFCLDHWGWGRARAYQLMDFKIIRGELEDQGVTVLPENESQVRSLKKLKTPEERMEAWGDAIEMSQIVDKAPPQITVAEAVAAKLPKPKTRPSQHQCRCGHWHVPHADYVDGREAILRPDKLGQNRMRRMAESIFSERSGLAKPDPATAAQSKEAGKRWWAPLREICELAEWEEQRVEGLIVEAVTRMRESDLTIASPQSILQVSRSIIGEIQTRSFEPHA